MNISQALEGIERDIEAAVDLDFAGNVVGIKSKTARYAPPSPVGEQDQIAGVHRKMVSQRKQGIADTKKGLKATLASIAAARKAEKARYEAMIADLAEREAEAKEQAAKDIEADQKIVASCEAALEILTAE